MTNPEIVRRAPARGCDAWSWPDDMHPVLRRVLSRRSIGSPDELDLRLNRIAPVSTFDALFPAVELLLAHRERRIVVVGDFDADGATSTALCLLVLKALGFASVEPFTPDRFTLGYGLSPEAVERVLPLDPSLIVTVDNGISSVDGVDAARRAGVDVLVTDHHLPPARLPRANAIVNPNLPGVAFPGKQMAGVGVAFYLLAALCRAAGRATLVSDYLDLVALGTVADLVSLDFQNRILVEQGLRRIRAGRCRPGVRALCRVAGVDPCDVTAPALGYQLAPRLNAAGRLDDMSIGVRCLAAATESEAMPLAEMLDRLNRERRGIESQMSAEAHALVDKLDVLDGAALPPVICLHRPDWHEGLVGLVASRVKERYHRPVFAFAATASGLCKGSGRSIAGFHLRDALADVDASRPGLIDRFGGHAMAAGLSLAAEALAEFEREIRAVAASRLPAEMLSAALVTDGTLDPSDLTLDAAEALCHGAPWGQGFPEPCFDGEFELLEWRIVGEKHLRMSLTPVGGDAPIEAIAFNRSVCDWREGAKLRVVYRLSVNRFRSTPRAQLIVEHLQTAG